MYENRELAKITRSASLKRRSEYSAENDFIKKPKLRRFHADDKENNNQTCYDIKYVPSRREVSSLVLDNYIYQRVSGNTNKDGSIGWRCKENRSKIKCPSTCRVAPNGEIIRKPAPHNHPCESDANLIYMKAKADAKKRCRSENNTPVKEIFLEEMSKAIMNNGLQLTPDVIKKMKIGQKCLQIQRDKRHSGMSLNDDSLSTTSSDDCSAKSDSVFDDHSNPKSPEVQMKSQSVITPNETNKAKSAQKNKGLDNIVSKLQKSPENDIKNESESIAISDLNETEHNNIKAVPNNNHLAVSVKKKKGLDSIVSGLWQSSDAKESESTKSAEKINQTKQANDDKVIINHNINKIKIISGKKRKGLDSIVSGLWQSPKIQTVDEPESLKAFEKSDQFEEINSNMASALNNKIDSGKKKKGLDSIVSGLWQSQK